MRFLVLFVIASLAVSFVSCYKTQNEELDELFNELEKDRTEKRQRQFHGNDEIYYDSDELADDEDAEEDDDEGEIDIDDDGDSDNGGEYEYNGDHKSDLELEQEDLDDDENENIGVDGDKQNGTAAAQKKKLLITKVVEVVTTATPTTEKTSTTKQLKTTTSSSTSKNSLPRKKIYHHHHNYHLSQRRYAARLLSKLLHRDGYRGYRRSRLRYSHRHRSSRPCHMHCYYVHTRHSTSRRRVRCVCK